MHVTVSPADFTLDLAGPIDLPASLLPLGRWGDDGLDRWDGRLLARTVHPATDSGPVPFMARPAGTAERPALEVTLVGPRQPAVDRAIRATFAAEPSSLAALARLASEDEAVATLAGRYPGLVPVLFPDPFTALVRSISAQQVNLRWAVQIRRRLALAYGTRHELGATFVYSLCPEPLTTVTVAELRALQLTTAKSMSLIACAGAAVEGGLERTELAQLDDDEVIRRLTLLPGIGRWSAEWFLARTLGRPRVVAGDLGVRKAVGRLYLDSAMPTEEEVRRLTGHWGGAASLAQALALHDLAELPGPQAGRAGARPQVGRALSLAGRSRRAPAPRGG